MIFIFKSGTSQKIVKAGNQKSHKIPSSRMAIVNVLVQSPRFVPFYVCNSLKHKYGATLAIAILNINDSFNVTYACLLTGSHTIRHFTAQFVYSKYCCKIFRCACDVFVAFILMPTDNDMVTSKFITYSFFHEFKIPLWLFLFSLQTMR